MKRALAERAKQSLPQQQYPDVLPSLTTLGPGHLSNSTNASPEQPPPLKVPRLEQPPAILQSLPLAISSSDEGSGIHLPEKAVGSGENCTLASSQGTSNDQPLPKPDETEPSDTSTTKLKSTSKGNSSTSKGRPRAPSSRSGAARGQQSPRNLPPGSESKDFYLQHQNRALATELHSLQFSVRSLEAERDYRRQHCLTACQALNSLQATWTQLETALCFAGPSNMVHSSSAQEVAMGGGTLSINSSSIATEAGMVLSQEHSNDELKAEEGLPASTGTGGSVEWTRALSEALAALGRPANANMDPNSHPHYLTDLSQISSDVAARASVLQDWIGRILKQKMESINACDDKVLPSNQAQSMFMEKSDLERQIADLNAQIKLLETQISELQGARDEVSTRERRIRRNLYRLSAGMMTVEQVIKTLDGSDRDDDLAVVAEVKLEAQQYRQQVSGEDSNNGQGARGDENSEHADSEAQKLSARQVHELQSRIQLLESSIESREKSLQELGSLVKEKEIRINELSIRQQSKEDSEKLLSLELMTVKLKSAEASIAELEENLVGVREKWAQSLGNEKSALASIEELVGKFKKRWNELAQELGGTGAGEVNLDEMLVGSMFAEERIAQSKQIVELQHKLNQALESARQAESVRDVLKEALLLNESMQAKLDEVKTKQSSSQSGKNHSASSSHRSGNTENHAVDGSGGSTPKEKDATHHERPVEGSKSERLHREYKKLRKDLASLTASKESLKAKLDRSEKERESLFESNARLLKQISDKDEMNAKSLSTILHLKSLTEQLGLERDNMEQQAKSAAQLSLAARLAANAKERVSEEFLKEKLLLESKLGDREDQLIAVKAELDRIKQEWSEASGSLVALRNQLANATKRSDELASDNEKKREEIRKLVDSVERAESDSREARERLEAIAHKSGKDKAADSPYTVEQLMTQVGVLKAKLECPVCHNQEKNCVILKCGHMHCRQCIDDVVKNRSRMCPTCALKFGKDDGVFDVRLT